MGLSVAFMVGVGMARGWKNQPRREAGLGETFYGCLIGVFSDGGGGIDLGSRPRTKTTAQNGMVVPNTNPETTGCPK